jgi:hypothetical protein
MHNENSRKPDNMHCMHNENSRKPGMQAMRIVENLALALQEYPDVEGVVMAFDLMCLKVGDKWCYRE